MTIAEAIVNLAQQGFLDRLEESTPEGEEEQGMRIGEESRAWALEHVQDDVVPFQDVLAKWAEQAAKD